MTVDADWIGRVGRVWADEWRRTDQALAGVSHHLDAAVLAVAPDRGFALDIGCGAGTTTFTLAAARPDLHVTGVDLSPSLVSVARQRAAAAGTDDRCRFEVGAAQEFFAVEPFDLLFSRHGVMFFDDPAGAFSRLRALARPAGALVFSCFADRSANRFASLADELLGQSPRPGGDAPGPFAFADPARVATVLDASGWQAAAPTRLSISYRVGHGPDPVARAVAFLSRIGPVAGVIRDAADPSAVRRELARLLEHYRTADAIDLPASAWIWRARAREAS